MKTGELPSLINLHFACISYSTSQIHAIRSKHPHFSLRWHCRVRYLSVLSDYRYVNSWWSFSYPVFTLWTNTM